MTRERIFALKIMVERRSGEIMTNDSRISHNQDHSRTFSTRRERGETSTKNIDPPESTEKPMSGAEFPSAKIFLAFTIVALAFGAGIGARHLVETDMMGKAPKRAYARASFARDHGESEREMEARAIKFDQKEKDLLGRKERFELIRADIQKEMAKLESSRRRLEELIQIRADLEKETVRKLAQSYTSMPPKKVAALLGRLDQELAAKILITMSPSAAGAALAEAPSELALALSLLITRGRIEKTGQQTQPDDEPLSEPSAKPPTPRRGRL